jgi:hypothetical protein
LTLIILFKLYSYITRVIFKIKFSLILAFMKKYPEHRKPSGYRKCDICGKTVKARGIGGHKYIKHGIVVKTILHNSCDNSCNNSSNLVIRPDDLDVKKISNISSKDLRECKRLDGQHFYTDNDLWILLSRICRSVLTEHTGDLLSMLDTNEFVSKLIEDFEQRFKCKFGDVRRANPHIKTGKTNEENWVIVTQYESLKYSK